ncbi:MAG TPA: ATP-binding protein [Candidatus Binatus sp.]|uniref:sensor histidine kinase n=1 Tax=Candidatus Binatus sp. TaxID=2811406 RepID=UPI002B47DD64|nr:ATP-binding protein [Candidatus Binatus sp.]HKN14644.1 ATP-binding protein [Candidatus Binatus sp.]
MNAPSMQRQIRNGTLLMLALVVLLGLYTLPRVYALGGAIRATLYRNYISIEAAQNMHAALNTLQVAEHDGRARDVLPGARQNFMQWNDVEDHNFTEAGEPELAGDITKRANKLFADVAAAPPGTYHDREFAELHGRLDDLIAMNKAAMFRADSRSVKLGKDLAYEFAGGLALVLLVGAAVSWGLGWRLSKPLTELTERLRGISQRKSQVRLGPQPLAELEAVAREFNQMAERLEQYDKLNVERLVYEKSKTEAIIESLEDGVVLIDTEGIVAHINEIASLILGVDPQDALGSPFDDLSSNHPHYLRVRDALRTLQKAGPDGHRTEINLHVRGRDHSYVLKPVPLHHTVGKSLGTLLILQDVTYIRDQDRARTNLVATLSHELRTPLTSLALSAELLSREGAPAANPKSNELMQVILEECSRMRQLTDNLLNLARGEIPAIAVQQKRLDLARLASDVTRRFAIQAREKHVEIEEHIGPVPEIIGDPVKLSWVISNLLGNALRYTPAGGTIKVSALGTEQATRLEVTDSGPGIPADMKDYIFERFVQYGSDGFEKGSAGLGLSIVKEIVEAHGGRIFVESANSHGARFIVEIPAAMEI